MPGPDKVYYFATCLIDLLYPRAGLAGMQLIRRAGTEVIFPENQTCCIIWSGFASFGSFQSSGENECRSSSMASA